MAFQSGAVFSEVTLFPKKGIALVLHISYFFLGDGLKPKKPSRQGSSRGPRGLARVGAKKPKRSSQVFSARAFSQPAAGGVEKDRPNLSFASRSVGGLDASARSEAPTGTTGSRRVASSIRARSREHVTCLAVFRTQHEHHITRAACFREIVDTKLLSRHETLANLMNSFALRPYSTKTKSL